MRIVVPHDKLNLCCRMLSLGQAAKEHVWLDQINSYGTIIALPLGPVHNTPKFQVDGVRNRDVPVTALAYDEDSNHVYVLRANVPAYGEKMRYSKSQDMHNMVMSHWLAGECEGTFKMICPFATTERLVIRGNFEVHTPRSIEPVIVPMVNASGELPIITVDALNIGYLS